MEHSSITSSLSSAVFELVQRRELKNRLAEVSLWASIFVIFTLGLFANAAFDGVPLVDVFFFRHIELILVFATLLFPFVFQLIFGSLPLEFIRRKRALKQQETQERPAEIKAATEIRDAEMRVLSDSLSADQLSLSPATKLFAYYASSSRRLSQSIYSRAGVYLLVGVTVAFSGLAFFYAQTAQLAPTSLVGGMTLLAALAPKFGILFFIELVAFFFLRQYRSAMDEFRYYEAIKRNREETLALIRIAADSEKPIDPMDFVKNGSFFSKAGVLEKEHSSEIIESRKLEKNELDILEKVIDIVSRSKK